MKKAFTMLELVFVIVVVGILSYMVASSFTRNPLREAADQVVSHIRYTQHLAMMDDKFFDPSIPTPGSWYQTRWQIKFNNTVGSGQQWAYTIYSDMDQDGAADTDEFANNPLDSSKKLTGGWTTILVGNSAITDDLRLGNKYGVTGVTFTGGCLSGATQLWLSFDYLGRPLYRDAQNLTSTYKDGNNNRLIRADCNITLSNGVNNVIITVKPETGYTYVSGQN